MQTNFSPDQLKDSHMAASEKILRSCVHCGFCTATCPTYLLLGDELDSPRGRIYMIKDMLENNKPATPEVVKHVDRCLSCLSCMTTCPSGVHYMHLVDHARAHIEQTYTRSFSDRFMRQLLALILPYPNRFRLALAGAWLVGRVLALRSWLSPVNKAKHLALHHGAAPIAAKVGFFKRTFAMLALAPARLPGRSPYDKPQTVSPNGTRKGRVALLNGCAQPVLKPGINEAAIQLMIRAGIEVVLPKGEVCCGALVHHMGRKHDALNNARTNVDAWTREIEGTGLDSILITASGCGTTIKDYGFMLRDDPAYAEKAARVSTLALDITEYLTREGIGAVLPKNGITVAYHSACSMQHGQKITDLPKKLLTQAGFTVKDVPESHICCGSAGTYNIMQPDIAVQLRDRKVANILKTKPDVIAAGNIGCITQIATACDVPIVHTAELLNWVAGGPRPEGLPSGLQLPH